MKGLTSWTATAGAGGWETDERCRNEIAAMNALIEQIEDDLLIGTPADLASSDAGTVLTGIVGNESWPKERVAVAALTCGPDAIVVTAANHIPASKPLPPTIQPANDVTITVALPDYLPDVTAFEVTPAGLASVACSVTGGRALLKLATIETGRVFVLRRNQR